MQNIKLGKAQKFIVHFVGNKNQEDGVKFSDELTPFAGIEPHLSQLLTSCLKTDNFYQFHFLPVLSLNPVYQFINGIFEDNSLFVQQTKNAGRYLYDKSTHPNIKSGEFCVVYLKDCQVDNELADCIAFIKSENKETILKIDTSNIGFAVTDVTGISLNKIDKGCLIFNIEKSSGYLISVVDNTNKSQEAQYWKDEFLSVKPKKNEYNQTNQFLGIAKQFVTKQLTEDFEIDKPARIDMLNRSVEYFKTHETFDKQQFEDEVFNDLGVIDSFRKFDQEYRQQNELDLSDNFSISPQAVKKQSRVFKNVLKLDRNFDIYIHSNNGIIEKGIEKDGRKYYKIYYDQEK